MDNEYTYFVSYITINNHEITGYGDAVFKTNDKVTLENWSEKKSVMVKEYNLQDCQVVLTALNRLD